LPGGRLARERRGRAGGAPGDAAGPGARPGAARARAGAQAAAALRRARHGGLRLPAHVHRGPGRGRGHAEGGLMATESIERNLLPQVAAVASHIGAEVGRAYIGEPETTEILLVALLARGHVLLEGVPGVAKTTLVKAFAKTLGCSFRRIQFTPD